MCRHRHRQIGQLLKSGKICPFQFRFWGFDHWKPEVGIRRSPPVARNVLENGQNTALLQPLRHGSGDGRDLARLRAVGAIANHCVCPCYGHIRQRQAVNADAEVAEIGRDQAPAQPRSR